MSDASYGPKVYRKSGGDIMVIANGGQILVEPGGSVMSGNPTGAADYFVDGNVSATGDGSINSPFLTFAEAITASNASIKLTANRWWAKRNRIFVMGDGITEDLTVIPEKCDVIGVGYDIYPFPRIIGNHVIAAIATSGAKGCRFINMGWICDAAGPLFTIPAICHGIQFLGGLMQPKSSGSTIAISLTDIAGVVIDGVKIDYNAGGGIFAEGIKIAGTQGHEIAIKNCDIYATEGIHVTATATTGGIIDNNNIYATALTINDESLKFRVTRNQLISAAAVSVTAGGLGIVCNEHLASGNKIGGTNGAHNADYPFVVALTS